jgi:hypothetical protein
VGELYRLPSDRDGARMLAEEFLRADLIVFLVGKWINELYQNPHLPRSLFIRRSLVEELAQFIHSLNSEVVIEYC